jgi:WD40 repeat protein
MASTLTKPTTRKSILTPSMTLQGRPGSSYSDITYFLDGHRLFSISGGHTARQWDLKTGKVIEEAREVCEKIFVVAISRDGRWVVIGGRDEGGEEHWHDGGIHQTAELRVCEVETGIVKNLQGHSHIINCIDISVDSKLVVGGAQNSTMRIWNLDTGKLVAGPFKSQNGSMNAVRFSTDLKKLAAKMLEGNCLEIWDIQSQKLDVRVGEYTGALLLTVPVFWTNKNKKIIV